jgi:TPP-dependent pyruvate/acetoin dehydrogenase alpha subunit
VKAVSEKQDAQTRELWLRMFRTMTRIRKFEEAARQQYFAGKLTGFMHFSVGQEAIPTGVSSALREDDYISTTHRGHGDSIAKGAAVEAAIAELFGKATGSCRGKGGSLHIADLSKNILGANGIVAGGIAIGLGAAFSAKYRGTDQVAVSYFGDGALQCGPTHECLSMASLWCLPAIFVRQNNLYGVSTRIDTVQGIPDVVPWAASYGMPATRIDGNDVLAVYEAAQSAVTRARAGKGPSFIECETYRRYGHNVSDDRGLWRPKGEREAWAEKDPIARFRKVIVERGIGAAEELDAIDAEEGDRLERAVELAVQAPTPELQTALEDVYLDPVLGARAVQGVRP